MSNKTYQMIIASTHLDAHRHQHTVEDLYVMVNKINSDEKKMRLGIDHRRDFPPKGKLHSAELMERGGYHYVLANFSEYEKSETVIWNKDLIIEYNYTPFKFIEVNETEPSVTSISLDPNNFLKGADFKEIINASQKNNLDITFKNHYRKADTAIPEILIQLASSLSIYELVKPSLKKTGEKIADKLTDKGLDTLDKSTRSIRIILTESIHRLIPITKPVMVIFDLPGKPHVELIAKTRDTGLILQSLNEKKLIKIREEINFFNEKVEIAKIQFLLTEKGKWKFNYLISETGQTIGRKTAFNKRDQRFLIINKMTDNKPGASIGFET